MMTRGNSRVSAAPVASSASGTHPQECPAKCSKASKVALHSKQVRTTATSTVNRGPAPPVLEVAHPSQLKQVPLTSAQPPQQSPLLQDIWTIVSSAAIEGLRVAGIFSDVPPVSSKEESNQAGSVQGSLAAMIHYITAEQNSP